MDNFKGKKLLILGGASLHNRFVEEAKDMGIITIVTDNVSSSPAKKIADIRYDVNVSDIDGLIKICEKEHVDGIISGYLDFCQRYYQKLCNKMNLPCYGTHEQFEILTNKELFKKKCIEVGVDIIPSYTEDDFNIDNFNIEYPVYVKPSYSRGSRGQKICHSREEAIEAIKVAKDISEDNQAVIEKYIDSDIIQVTYIVVNGKPYLIRTTDQYNGYKKDGMDHICTLALSPSVYTKMYIDKVHSKVQKLIKALGIVNAPFFMQGFIDGDKVRFFDPGLRFPGTEFSRALKKVTGINTTKALIEFAFTGKMDSVLENLKDDSVYLDNHIIVNMFPSINKGKITKITSEDDLLKIPGVLKVTFRRNIGDVMVFTGDVNQRIAEINLLADSKDEMKKTIQKVNDTLIVLDENNYDMVFSKFDINDLK